MRALITGGGGQLASDLATLLGEDARVFDRTTLDIADSDRLDRVFAEAEPDVVFNCAAFHNVDVCETEPERAWQVNVEAVRQLALAANAGPHLDELRVRWRASGALRGARRSVPSLDLRTHETRRRICRGRLL